MKKQRWTHKEWSWMLYDGGNSAFSMTVVTALFPVYFDMVSKGRSMDIGYYSTAAGIVIALLSPILGTIADYQGYKKRFFIVFSGLGILVTALLAVIGGDNIQGLAIAYMFSNIGFAAANVFYDAFLVDVTQPKRMDRISSGGYAFGYIASVIPFLICMIFVVALGMEKNLGYQLSFVLTALWWAIFTLPLLKNVRQVHYIKQEKKPVKSSFKRLWQTFKHIQEYKWVLWFLVAYFFYIDGVGTIIKMAVPYIESILDLESLGTVILLGILLVIQLVAFPFALLYGYLAERFSAKTMILVGIITYIVIVFAAFSIQELWQVFVLGMLIGSAQGGIQALSRSYFAKLIPADCSNEFFGFYNIFGKFAAIIGPLLMSLTSTLLSSARASIIAILPLFIIGFVILWFLPSERAEEKNS